MTDYRKFFNKPYLGHWDLAGKDVVVTIEAVEEVKLYNPSKKADESKPLMTLRGTKKKMICNVTNAKIIAKLYGDDTKGWIGKPIALYKTTTNAQGGEQVECIRVRPQAPQRRRQADPDPEPGANDAPDEEAP